MKSSNFHFQMGEHLSTRELSEVVAGFASQHPSEEVEVFRKALKALVKRELDENISSLPELLAAEKEAAVSNTLSAIKMYLDRVGRENCSLLYAKEKVLAFLEDGVDEGVLVKREGGRFLRR